MMLEFINRFERLVYMLLIALLVVVLIFAMGEMFWYLWVSVTNAPIGLLENHELTSVLGTFLLVLIAVELLDTMKAYIEENVIHVEIVVLLAIIAIARKVILLDPAQTNGFELIGIGIIIIGLAAAYYLMRKAGFTIGTPKEKHPEKIEP
ncbi:MAG: phosphate-starvation-inducible PsiE family protein [Methanoregula sp.]|nr:phosphate-starvation-inducible PsiE family protein [Methanoregula sp.]